MDNFDIVETKNGAVIISAADNMVDIHIDEDGEELNLRLSVSECNSIIEALNECIIRFRM